MTDAEHLQTAFRGIRLGKSARYTFGDGILYNGKGERIARLGLLASGILETLILHPGLTLPVKQLAGAAGEVVMEQITFNNETIQWLPFSEIARVQASIKNIRHSLERAESGLSKHLKTNRVRGYTWYDL